MPGPVLGAGDGAAHIEPGEGAGRRGRVGRRWEGGVCAGVAGGDLRALAQAEVGVSGNGAVLPLSGGETGRLGSGVWAVGGELQVTAPSGCSCGRQCRPGPFVWMGLGGGLASAAPLVGGRVGGWLRCWPTFSSCRELLVPGPKTRAQGSEVRSSWRETLPGGAERRAAASLPSDLWAWEQGGPSAPLLASQPPDGSLGGAAMHSEFLVTMTQ